MSTEIYFLRPVGHDGPIKIGCSKDATKRLRALEIWSPMLLEIVATAPGAFSHESVLHQMFAEYRRHGEWFDISPRLAELIAHVQDHGKLPPLDMSLRPYTQKRGDPKVKSAMKRRRPEVQRRKWQISRMVQKAERRAFGFLAEEVFRPAEIDAIMATQHGFWADPIGGDDLAKLEEYIDRLKAMPAASSNMNAWDRFATLVRERAA